MRKAGEVGMTKIVCDRCGKEAQDESNVALYEPHYCTETDGHRFVTKKSYDLCDECIAELIKWISAEGEETG